MESFICNQYGEKLTILSTENVEIYGCITEVEAIKMQFVFIFSTCAECLQKICIFKFPRLCSNMPKVRWVIAYGCCRKFRTLSNSAKNFENRLTFDKVTESLKVGTFLKHSVVAAAASVLVNDDACYCSDSCV